MLVRLDISVEDVVRCLGIVKMYLKVKKKYLLKTLYLNCEHEL